MSDCSIRILVRLVGFLIGCGIGIGIIYLLEIIGNVRRNRRYRRKEKALREEEERRGHVTLTIEIKE